MILDYLEKVRQKPRAARKRFAFLVSVGLTSIIAIGWAFTLPARFASLSIKEDDMMANVNQEDIGALDQGRNTPTDADEARNALDAYPSAEMQEQLRAEGFIQGGSEGDFAQTSSTVVVAPQVIIIATSSSSAGVTASSTTP